MFKLLSSVATIAVLTACSGDTPDANSAPDDMSSPDVSIGSQSVGKTPGYNSNRNAYFGDLHIHTRNSFDAYIFNVRRTADDAYRFAKGESIEHPGGYDITIAGGPLDFYAVTDHAEYLGILPAMDTPGDPLNELPVAGEMFSEDPAEITAALEDLARSVRTGDRLDEMYHPDRISNIWQRNIDAAERHNDPGVFTTFAAYEYSSMYIVDRAGPLGGGNLHRNVIFRGEAPARAFSTLDSTNPEDLWDWMDDQRDLGLESIAIPHNSNVSDGQMFRLETYEGAPLSVEYADQRMRNEPLVEVTQVKGTSETHPDLSPNDEWADFEIFTQLLASYEVSITEGSYVREAYRNGLQLEENEGFNPFKFGLIGASDSHIAGGAYSEEDYWSKLGIVDAQPFSRGSIPYPGTDSWEDQPTEGTPGLQARNAREWFSRWGASGLTGVWAEENTRDSIFDAFRRKETFATTGPRMKVRFFGGYDFDQLAIDAPDLVAKAYESGVPMGADLAGNGSAPSFLVWGMRDPGTTSLQRAQIIKVTSTGEQVYDVACHIGAPDPDSHRCPDNGASVDMATCTPTGGGASELKTFWTDPDFQADESAAYYVRLLENPTCRWSTWEALRNGTEPRPGRPQTIQERAYTSPIWYVAAPQ